MNFPKLKAMWGWIDLFFLLNFEDKGENEGVKH